MPDVMTFEPLTSSALEEWLANSRARYIEERIAAGDSRAEAESNARRSIEGLFPDGSPAPGQLVGRLFVRRLPVGYLWVGVAGLDSNRWWVWEVLIDEDFRRRGHGRQAMLLAEELALAHGASTIGLNVFGHNRVARNLYSSLGYGETSVQMRKDLSQTSVFGNTKSYNQGMSKVMVSLPEDLVRDIDEEARRRSMSRSALLAAAARRELARRDPEAVADAIARSEQRFRDAGAFDAAELVRQDRDNRR
jgi:ribosomal protein S18 acetylase RimI-like enzyme